MRVPEVSEPVDDSCTTCGLFTGEETKREEREGEQTFAGRIDGTVSESRYVLADVFMRFFFRETNERDIKLDGIIIRNPIDVPSI